MLQSSRPRFARATGNRPASAVAENGDIVAATLDGEATVKRFKREDGHVWLLPHNSAYEPIPGADATWWRYCGASNSRGGQVVLAG